MLEANNADELLQDINDFITLKDIEIMPNDESESTLARDESAPKWNLLTLGCKISENATTFNCPKIRKYVPNCLFCNLRRQPRGVNAIACIADTKSFETIKNKIVNDLKLEKGGGKLSLGTFIGKC